MAVTDITIVKIFLIRWMDLLAAHSKKKKKKKNTGN